MIVFEVPLNSRHLCRAGLSEAGVLACILRLVNVDPLQPTDNPTLLVNALSHTGVKSSELEWVRKSLKEGDVVTIKIMNSNEGVSPHNVVDLEDSVLH